MREEEEEEKVKKKKKNRELHETQEDIAKELFL